MDGLDADDAALIDEFETAAAVWTQIKIKYFKTNKNTARINMSAIQNFKFTSESTIDGSWMKLKEYRRKIIAANKTYTSSYNDDVLFHILTSALYKANIYVNILDGLLSQNLSVQESLKILQEKEAQVAEEKSWNLGTSEKGFPSRRRRKQSYGRKGYNSDSDVDMKDTILECFCCGSGEHFVADCPYQDESRKYARKLWLIDERSNRPKQKAKSKQTSRKFKSDKKFKTEKPRTQRTKKGHAAIESDTASLETSDANSSSSDSESLDDEAVALSKEHIKKDL